MSTYVYRGVTREGRSVRGSVEAGSPKEARAILHASGVVVESLRAVHPLTPASDRHGSTARARAEIYRSLAELMAAGLPAGEAVAAAADMMSQARARSRLGAALEKIREGQSLSAAFRAAGLTGSDAEAALIQAGERSGALTELMRQLADFLEREAQVRERVAALAAYPALVAALTFVVAAVMFFAVMPRFVAMLSGAGVTLPPSTLTLLWTARALLGSLGLLLLGGTALAVSLFRQGAAGRRRLELIATRLPGLRTVLSSLNTARFAEALALLLRGGLGAVDALRIAVDACGSALAASRRDAACAAVEHGTSLSQAVADLPGIDPGLIRWLRVGEASGDVARLAQRAAESYLRRWTRSAERLVTVLEPAMVIAVGLLVLAVAVNLLLPVLNLTRGLGL